MTKWLLILTNTDGSASRNVVINCSKTAMKHCVHYYQRSWGRVQVYKLKEVTVK